MAQRGDVLVARRRLGFGASGRREHFVVVQSDVATALDTVVVAALDEDAPMWLSHPFCVRVSAKEAGAPTAHVVLAHLLSAPSLDVFESGAVGRLLPRSMRAVDAALRDVLDV